MTPFSPRAHRPTLTRAPPASNILAAAPDVFLHNSSCRLRVDILQQFPRYHIPFQISHHG
jgi:hypothetical protein